MAQRTKGPDLRSLFAGVRWVNIDCPARLRRDLEPGFDRDEEMARVLCVLYDDPVGGYPGSYARDGVPKIERYPGSQTTPTPKRIDFKPGELLGSVANGPV